MNIDSTAVIQRRRRILESIRKAMRRACNDMFRFTEQSGRDLAAEYLLTVRIAEAIAEDFSPLLKVHLEMRTHKFATQCLRLLKKVFTVDPARSRTVFRKGQDIAKRPGRIDVAVSAGDGEELSICAIEVKRLNPSGGLVRKDLERNAAYFALRNEFGDPPTVEFTAFAAFHRYRPGYRVEDINRARSLYRRWMEKVDLRNGVASHLEVIPVDQLREPEYNPEAREVDMNPYLMMGILIIYYWADHGNEINVGPPPA